MKKAILVLAVAMAANIANAKVTCLLAKEQTAGSGTYDREIYAGDIESSALIVVSPQEKVTVVTEQFNQVASQDGNLFFAVSANEGRLSLGSGHIDMKQQNVTPVAAMTSVLLSQDPAYLLTEGVALVCRQQ